jgi:hypothetical protein
MNSWVDSLKLILKDERGVSQDSNIEPSDQVVKVGEGWVREYYRGEVSPYH